MLGPKTKMGSITWTLLQTQNLRASLVVHAPSAEDLGSIPGQRTRLHAPVQRTRVRSLVRELDCMCSN